MISALNLKQMELNAPSAFSFFYTEESFPLAPENRKLNDFA